MDHRFAAKFAVIAMMFAILLGAAACSSAPVPEIVITAKDFRFMPASVTVPAGKKVRLYTDQFRSHFYLGDCAAAIGLALERKLTGLYHISPGRKESRYAVGMALAEKLGLDRSLIEAISMDDAAMDAKRPKDCSLSNAKFTAATGFEPMALGKSLEYLRAEFAE